MLTKSRVGELRKKTKSKQIAICMCYYFGLQHLFLFARLGEPHSFYTSRGHQYLWSQTGHFHKLNARLADCRICSVIPHWDRQTSIRMFTRLVCNLVLSKGCILAQHQRISVASKGWGRAKVPMYLYPARLARRHVRHWSVVVIYLQTLSLTGHG